MVSYLGAFHIPSIQSEFDRDQTPERFGSGRGSPKKAKCAAIWEILLMRDNFTTAREIAELNIEHYSKLLKTALDERTRRTVEELLEAERAKLANLNR